MNRVVKLFRSSPSVMAAFGLLGALLLSGVSPAAADDQAPSASISGRVSVTDGKPLGLSLGLTVSARKLGDSYFYTTTQVSSQGLYVLESSQISPGDSFIVKFEADYGDYEEQWYQGKTNADEATPVTIPSSGPTDVTGIDFLVEPTTASIAGKVTGPDGAALNPSSEIFVSACPEQDWYSQSGECHSHDESSDVVTADEESFVFRELKNDHKYVIQARDKHALYKPQVFHDGQPVTATHGHTNNVDFALEPNDVSGGIEGTVSVPGEFDEQADLMAYVYGAATDEEVGRSYLQQHGESEGKYSVFNLAPGEYKVVVKDKKHHYQDQWFDDAANFENAQLVTVDGGQVETGIDFSLKPAPTINGRLIGPNGQAVLIQSLNVYAYTLDNDDDEVSVASIRDDGSYMLYGLTPGEQYKLKVLDVGRFPIYASAWYDNQPNFAKATPVTLGAEGTTVDMSVNYLGKPDSPTNVRAVASGTNATISWTPGPSNGYPITEFSVSGSYGKNCYTSGSATSCQVHGLSRGVRYSFVVTATNHGGTSRPSTYGSLVIPKLNQTIKKPASSMKRKKKLTVAAKSNQGVALRWTSQSTKICTVKGNKVTAKNRKGTCKIRATAGSNATYNAKTQNFAIKVK